MNTTVRHWTVIKFAPATASHSAERFSRLPDQDRPLFITLRYEGKKALTGFKYDMRPLQDCSCSGLTFDDQTSSGGYHSACFLRKNEPAIGLSMVELNPLCKASGCIVFIVSMTKSSLPRGTSTIMTLPPASRWS